MRGGGGYRSVPRSYGEDLKSLGVKKYLGSSKVLTL